MIEIYAIYKFCKLIGQRLRAKGRNPLLFQFLLVILWFVFEIIGAQVGIVLLRSGAGVYFCALLGALAAVVLLTAIINQIPSRYETLIDEVPVAPSSTEGLDTTDHQGPS